MTRFSPFPVTLIVLLGLSLVLNVKFGLDWISSTTRENRLLHTSNETLINNYLFDELRIKLSSGADASQLSSNGESILFKCIEDPKLMPAFKILLHFGARMDVKNSSGESLLEAAIVRNNIEAVTEMFGKLVVVSDKDVLMWADSASTPDMAALVGEMVADLSDKKEGETRNVAE